MIVREQRGARLRRDDVLASLAPIWRAGDYISAGHQTAVSAISSGHLCCERSGMPRWRAISACVCLLPPMLSSYEIVISPRRIAELAIGHRWRGVRLRPLFRNGDGK